MGVLLLPCHYLLIRIESASRYLLIVFVIGIENRVVGNFAFETEATKAEESFKKLNSASLPSPINKLFLKAFRLLLTCRWHTLQLPFKLTITRAKTAHNDPLHAIIQLY